MIEENAIPTELFADSIAVQVVVPDFAPALIVLQRLKLSD
jgi:hypothetical protein